MLQYPKLFLWLFGAHTQNPPMSFHFTDNRIKSDPFGLPPRALTLSSRFSQRAPSRAFPLPPGNACPPPLSESHLLYLYFCLFSFSLLECIFPSLFSNTNSDPTLPGKAFLIIPVRIILWIVHFIHSLTNISH